MSRKDYFYRSDAPKPNSIKPAAAVVIRNPEGKILFLKRRDNEKWTLPGGTLDYGESLSACGVREVKEETGLDVRITGLIGIYTDPNILIAYSDGEVRQEFTIVYSAEFENGEIKIDGESYESKWASEEEAVALPMAESQKRRIADVVSFKQTGAVALR